MLIISIANRAGLPKTVIEYIKYAYTNCNTQLKYKKGISPSILVNRGVKQGDPMLRVIIEKKMLLDTLHFIAIEILRIYVYFNFFFIHI